MHRKFAAATKGANHFYPNGYTTDAHRNRVACAVHTAAGEAVLETRAPVGRDIASLTETLNIDLDSIHSRSMGRAAKTGLRLTRLDELADRFGIEAEYRDARGRVQRTDRGTKRLLLAAMGVRVDDDKHVDASLKEIDHSENRRTLQPVYVVRADEGPTSVRVTLSSGTREVAWRLRLEDGTEKSGRVKTEELVFSKQNGIDDRGVNRRKLPLGTGLPCGYHQLNIDAGPSEATVIVAPKQCWLPPAVNQRRKLWGLALQLYVLRSQANWGIGDFSDLRRLTESLAEKGADIVGVNPLHTMFLDNPEHASPYSPASRLLLNVLYIDVTAAPGFADCLEAQRLIESGEFQKKLGQCRSATLVDYTHVTELKLRALRLLFRHWNLAKDARQSSFEIFRRDRGEVLERSCVFQCLRQMFVGRDSALSDWRRWPHEFREPTSAAVTRFAEEHEEEICFGAWLQWLADAQLAAAAGAAEPMEVGLYRDMAVGADMSGVETWSNQEAVVSGAHIGAPPDIFNPGGQDWGIPPFNPGALKAQRYESFIELIRANMRHARALRIDHVMALQHLYWVPESRSPRDGAYVRYPMEELLGILALESQRNRCMVVGEDLGTVPNGFRERMAKANILSYRVLFFEQHMKSGVFRQPDEYPELSVGVASNHDLPTIRAWWAGGDVDLRERLHLYPDSKEAEFQRKLRSRDRTRLRQALEKQGVLPQSKELDPEELVLLVYTYLARSNSFAALIQLDDIVGEIDPVNLPGSTVEYPNWRRKLPLTLDELLGTPGLKEIVRMFAQERGSADRSVQSSAR